MSPGFARLKLLLHLVFVLSGITTVLIGPLLPILANNFLLNDLQLSYFFPSQFTGSLAGTFLTNWFGRRKKFANAAMIGAALMACGILLMNVNAFPVCLAGFFINGLGIGLTLPSINMLILELNPLRTAAALSILNFCWGLGAIVSKPFVDFFSSGSSIFWVTIALAVPLLGAAAMLATLRPQQINTEAEAEPDSKISQNTIKPIWTSPMAWAIAGFNFIHVGFESGMGGWLATYTDRIESQTTAHLISPTFLYFLFFVIGRGVAPLFFRFLNENKMLLLSLAVILIGMVVTLSADNLFLLGIGASISGFGTSSIFPTNLSRFAKTFGPEGMRRATPFFICGTLGAASTTWLIGFFSDRMGDLRSGMFVLAASISILIVLQIGLILFGASQKARATGRSVGTFFG